MLCTKSTINKLLLLYMYMPYAHMEIQLRVWESWSAGRHISHLLAPLLRDLPQGRCVDSAIEFQREVIQNNIPTDENLTGPRTSPD